MCSLTNNKKFLEILNEIDVSFNFIDDHIGSTLSCFKNLSALYCASNSITTIDENAFNFDNKIKILDFSTNSISTIPKSLFADRLPYLEYLDLSNNLIKQLDTWYFYLPAIQSLNLANNNIDEFINSYNWDVSAAKIFLSGLKLHKKFFVVFIAPALYHNVFY
jgi:Leucine-rich repeat (LRR) protein